VHVLWHRLKLALAVGFFTPQLSQYQHSLNMSTETTIQCFADVHVRRDDQMCCFIMVMNPLSHQLSRVLQRQRGSGATSRESWLKQEQIDIASPFYLTGAVSVLAPGSVGKVSKRRGPRLDSGCSRSQEANKSHHSSFIHV
jgi:hypothetical protein